MYANAEVFQNMNIASNQGHMNGRLSTFSGRISLFILRLCGLKSNLPAECTFGCSHTLLLPPQPFGPLSILLHLLVLLQNHFINKNFGWSGQFKANSSKPVDSQSQDTHWQVKKQDRVILISMCQVPMTKILDPIKMVWALYHSDGLLTMK